MKLKTVELISHFVQGPIGPAGLPGDDGVPGLMGFPGKRVSESITEFYMLLVPGAYEVRSPSGCS